MLLGLLGGKIARKIGLPKVTGYIITGLLIVPSVFGLISFETLKSMSLINDIALGLILFAIGGSFEIHHIRTIRPQSLVADAGAVSGRYGIGNRLFNMPQVWTPLHGHSNRHHRHCYRTGGNTAGRT